MKTKPYFKAAVTIEDIYTMMFGDESQVREMLTKSIDSQVSDEVRNEAIETSVDILFGKKVEK